VATVDSIGNVSGSVSGATMSGTFNSTDCTASGTWVCAGIYSGAWNLTRSASGPCFAPSPDEQPRPDQDLQPGNTVTLDHLWQWDDTVGRFVDPGSTGVTINPNLPIYLLTRGWDGSLDGHTCGSVMDSIDGDEGVTCSDLGTDHNKPNFAMSSVGAAIRRVKPDANLVAWDWAEAANPDSHCLADAALQQLKKDPSRCVDATGRTNLFCAAFATARAVHSFLADAAASASHVQEQGSALADAIRKYIGDHGAFGSQLHLIGKSEIVPAVVEVERFSVLSDARPLAIYAALDSPTTSFASTSSLAMSLGISL